MGALSMGITAFLPTFVQGSMGLSAVLAGATLGRDHPRSGRSAR